MNDRTKRKLLILSSTFASFAALFAAYWFTRPPELVWWRSPETGKMRKRVRVLIPNGWETSDYWGTTSFADFVIRPADRRPWFLEWFYGHSHEDGAVHVSLAQTSIPVSNGNIIPGGYAEAHWNTSLYNSPLQAEVRYYRSSQAAFNRTHRQVCNSLTIE